MPTMKTYMNVPAQKPSTEEKDVRDDWILLSPARYAELLKIEAQANLKELQHQQTLNRVISYCGTIIDDGLSYMEPDVVLMLLNIDPAEFKEDREKKNALASGILNRA